MRRVHRVPVVLFLALGWAILSASGCSCGGGGERQDGGIDASQEDAAQEDAWIPPDGYVPDGYVPDGYVPDGATGPFVSEIVPPAISRTVDNEVQIVGGGFQDGAQVTLTNCDVPGITYTFTATVSGDGGVATITVPADLTREQGVYTVTVTNPDGTTATLECAFTISANAPPTVTDVKPASASRGDPADGISSDQAVTITGTGFQSTPNVRWLELATGKLYDAKIVGFVSSTQITALCPSESKHMPVGDYHVWVVNPDQLAARWLVGGTTPGIFKIMPDPPPRIDTITPQSFPGSACTTTTMAVTGAGFVAGSSGTTFWIVMPSQTGCTGGRYDAQGNWICPITGEASDSTHATISLAPNCPQNGPYPIEAINPDGQAGFYYFVVLTPSSTCHLQAAGNSWTPVANSLQRGRYLFASATGCDEFGHAFIYAAGGLDGNSAVIDAVEFSEVNIYGVPGPWRQAMQYLNPANPRVVNTLGGLSNPQGRAGLTLVRVGRHLYAIGGAATNSNVDPATTQVEALRTTEHAFILGYETMPMAHIPSVDGPGGLPTGSWYYRISAIGTFGEGLASDEVVRLQSGGTLKVCWTVPDVPATKFNIYRTRASDGRSRTETLVAAGVDGIDSGIAGIRCFLDDGLRSLTPAPGRLRGVPVAGGALAAGTHRYRISATIDDGATPAFETLGGYEATVTLTAQGSVELHWDPVQYVAAYNVYKWSAADGKFVIVATTPGTSLSLTDDGALPAASCPLGRTDTPCAPLEGIEPLPPGSLSRWMASPVLLNEAREGLDGVPIVYEDDADPTLKRYFLVVAGGRSSNALGAGAFLNSVESVEVDATTGELISTNGFWSQETQRMNSPRAFFPLVTNQGRQDPVFCPPPAQPPCADFDGDGYFDCACASPDQMPCDCDDTDPEVHPGQTESGKCTNGKDDDCDTYVDCTDSDCTSDPNCTATCTTDADQDGHITVACGGDDCCDSGTEQSLGCGPQTAAGIHPGATEICGDGIDQDCDGADLPCACNTDADGDGHVSIACGGDDCCDSGTEGTDFFTGHGTLGCSVQNAANIHPGRFDVCQDGIDADCDGWDALCAWPGSAQKASRRDAGDGPMSVWPAPRRTPLGPGRPAPTEIALPKLYGADSRVWLIAAQGLASLQSTGNTGLSSLEACELAQTNAPQAGALLVACGPAQGLWALQVNAPAHTSFGHEALLYGQNPNAPSDPTVSCFYNFAGVQSQSVGSAPQVRNATEPRFPVYTVLNVSGHQDDPTYLLGTESQAGAPKPTTPRAYYQMVRLNGYVYVMGGHLGSGATPTVERIQQ